MFYIVPVSCSSSKKYNSIENAMKRSIDISKCAKRRIDSLRDVY